MSETTGDASQFGFWVDQLQLMGDVVVRPPRGGVTAVVGGNNVGKSTLLRQLAQALSTASTQGLQPQLLMGVELGEEGSPDDGVAWFDQHFRRRSPQQGAGWQVPSGGGDYLTADRFRWWGDPHRDDRGEGTLQMFLIGVRSTLSQQVAFETHGPVQMRAAGNDPATHPIHVFEDEPDRLHRFRAAVQSIFGESIELDVTGSHRVLRLGEVTQAAPRMVGEDRTAYVDALAELPLLAEQGDGMQRVVNILMHLTASQKKVVVLDEPEAYLHPPQARAIGHFIGRSASESGIQVFLATHDRNILAGLLDSNTDLAVLRLNRQGNSTSVHHLGVDDLREVWSDPVLRYSNVLDGLFHKLVVIAEGDSDCRFYQAALDALNEREPGQWHRTSDVLFVPVYGKQNIFKLATALQAVAVPVVASPDLDVLNDEALLRRLVESLGYDWAPIAQDYRVATESFRRPAEQVSVQQVGKSVERWLKEQADENPSRLWDGDLKEELRALTRAGSSPWRALKDFGQAAFQGQAAQVGQRLLDALDARRVVTVRLGDLEKFAPGTGVRKGPGWLPAALSDGAHQSEGALAHIRRVLRAGMAQGPIRASTDTTPV